MVDIFIIVFILAFLQFIYEGILAPSFRCFLRFKLFTHRDKLRNLKIQYGENITDEVFREMEDSVNSAINLLPEIDLTSVFRAHHAFKTDAELRERVARRHEIVSKCEINEAKKVMNRITLCFVFALTVNSFWALLMLLPFVILAIVLKNMQVFFEKVLLIPIHEANNLLAKRYGSQISNAG